MYRNYGWPRQDYSTDPAQRVARNEPLPQNVASAGWMKRSNVLGVLEKRLPFEFADSAEQPVVVDCDSCEVIVDEENKMVYDQRPVPDVPVTEAAADATSTAGTSRARTGHTAKSAPLETGAP